MTARPNTWNLTFVPPIVAPLPPHPPRTYAPVNACIYCGATDNLTKEHIVPFSAGGKWILPKASCKTCAAITGAFEGEFARTIIGPLRMLFNMPTRRPKDRPRHLEQKVKYPESIDWEIALVDRSVCPFLVLLPLYSLPELITGVREEGDRSSATKTMWVRGGGFWADKDAHLQWLSEALGATHVMPTGTLHTEPYCLTVLKVAHAFAVAELGLGAFEPLLPNMIRSRNLMERAMVMGGGRGDEPPSEQAHDVKLIEPEHYPGLVVVNVRLFASLGTPTHHVVAGRA